MGEQMASLSLLTWFNSVIKTANDFLWGMPMLALLLGTHVFLTFRLGFVQKHIGRAIKLSITKDNKAKGDVSQFAALSTALAATIGVGTIVGVATAVSFGGPGAVLWCWLTGIFGMATKYAEALLAVKYRIRTTDGTMLGGPMYALERGVKSKVLAIFFSISAAVAAFGIGNLTQANAISSIMLSQYNVPLHFVGIVIAVCTFFVIIGGVKTIASVCEAFVPAIAFLYLFGCLCLLTINFQFLPEAIFTIFASAFTPQAAGGGFVGSTIIIAARYGIARGLFSNESGLGSAPIAAAAAQTRNPVRQALVSMTGTFWDTVVMCLVTGLVLVTSILRDPTATEGLKGIDLTAQAFSQLPYVGVPFLAISIVTFAFTTILGWAYYGERAMEYLFGKGIMIYYRLAFVATSFLGAVTAIEIVWNFSDLANACMAIPNLISLLCLNGTLARETQKYIDGKKLDMVSGE